MNAKILLVHQAEDYLAHVQESRWIAIRDIDPVIRKEVVEILTTGGILVTRKKGITNYQQRYLRVIENEDWSEFKLVPTITNYGEQCEQTPKALGATQEEVQQDARTRQVHGDEVLQVPRVA